MKCEFPNCKNEGHPIGESFGAAILCRDHTFKLEELDDFDETENLIDFMLKITAKKRPQ